MINYMKYEIIKYYNNWKREQNDYNYKKLYNLLYKISRSVYHRMYKSQGINISFVEDITIDIMMKCLKWNIKNNNHINYFYVSIKNLYYRQFILRKSQVIFFETDDIINIIDYTDNLTITDTDYNMKYILSLVEDYNKHLLKINIKNNNKKERIDFGLKFYDLLYFKPHLDFNDIEDWMVEVFGFSNRFFKRWIYEFRNFIKMSKNLKKTDYI